jgi:hypothetical protein
MGMRETMSTRTVMFMTMAISTATTMSLGMGMTTPDLAGCTR